MRGAPLPEKGGPGRYDRAAWSLTLRPGSDCSPRQQDDTGKQNPQPAALLQYPSPPSPPPPPRLRGCPGRSDSWVHAAEFVISCVRSRDSSPDTGERAQRAGRCATPVRLLRTVTPGRDVCPGRAAGVRSRTLWICSSSAGAHHASRQQ